MGAALQYYTIDKGRAGGAPDAPTAYVAMCHLLCDSAEAYQASFGPYAQEISGDIRNFTDQTPIVQISEVVVENSAKGETEASNRHPAPLAMPVSGGKVGDNRRERTNTVRSSSTPSSMHVRPLVANHG